MFPRDNEAAWINRPGNGMHLRGKSRDRERERESLKRLIRKKDIEEYLKKNQCGDQ